MEDLAYEGKNLEKLVPFIKRNGLLNNFLAKLDITEEPVEMEDILFEVVEDIS